MISTSGWWRRRRGHSLPSPPPLRAVLRPIQGWHRLTAEYQTDGLAPLEDRPPGDCHLVGIGGSDDAQLRHGPQRGQMLDRLVGWPVLTQADGIVGPHEGHRCLHQGGDADRAAHVVGEREECSSERAGQTAEGDAVQRRPHRVLADPEVQNPPERAGSAPHR